MPFKYIIRELREIRNKSRTTRRTERKCVHGLGRSHIAPEMERFLSPFALAEQSRWASLPPELLLHIIQRVEASEIQWPARRDVVACAAVCKSWREATKEVVRTPLECGLITFPISLKQPGPRDSPIQCFIKRERATSTFLLYLGPSPALSGGGSKLLLAARKIRRATNTDFLISLAADDFSRTSDTYVGKLRSNFLGTKFIVYDSQPPHDSISQSNDQRHQKTYSKLLSAGLSAGNYNVASISYELNILRTRGPRRMRCTMHSIPISAIQEKQENRLNELSFPLSILKGKTQIAELSSSTVAEPLESILDSRDPLVLKNKSPRWHEHLQCWCLNFKGRVTVASVKNFQLVAAVDPHHSVQEAEQERVILQFGKIGKDIFTIDYRYPLSAFQAFTLCLSSFDTKPACE